MIREAHAGDVEALVALGLDIAARSDFQRDIEPSEDTIRALAERFAAGGDVVAFVDEREGVLAGVMGLAVFPHLVSGELQAASLCWWVRPECRGRGPALLTAAETWVRERGISTLHMCAPTERYGRLFAHRGYVQGETVFVGRM